ncbi:tetratricopeptide repeat-containing sulfotransferase family protein [Pseudoxanthomonas wuyuanensis]
MLVPGQTPSVAIPTTLRQVDGLLNAGRVDEAIVACRDILRRHADYAPALLLLSRALSRRGLHRQARDAALSAWATRPQDPAVLFEAGRRLRYFNEYEALEACYTMPAFTDHAPPQALTEAALSLSSIGLNEQALALVEAALRKAPELAAAYYMRGNIRSFMGAFDAAEADYELSLAKDPRMFQAAWMRSGLRAQTAESNSVDHLRKQLRHATPGGKGEIYLEFAMHKELHDLGRYDEAWQHLASGCQKKRALLNYRTDASRRVFSQLKKVCTARFVSDTVSPLPQPTPIFVVGMHRSGTTLIERVLAGHSQVHDAGETYAFAEEMKLATDQAGGLVLDAGLVDAAAGADFVRVAAGYATRATWLAQGKPFFTEKLPSNFLHAGFIAKALPQAKIVHLARNPMDTAFSNLRTLFSEAAPYSYEQTELADYVIESHKLMRWWQEVLGDRLLVVDYAHLVADFETQVRRIADFCGLPFEPAMLDIARDGGVVTTASAVQLRDGLRKDRGAAWLPYAEQLTPLRAALQAQQLLPDWVQRDDAHAR